MGNLIYLVATSDVFKPITAHYYKSTQTTLIINKIPGFCLIMFGLNCLSDTWHAINLWLNLGIESVFLNYTQEKKDKVRMRWKVNFSTRYVYGNIVLLKRNQLLLLQLVFRFRCMTDVLDNYCLEKKREIFYNWLKINLTFKSTLLLF